MVEYPMDAKVSSGISSESLALGGLLTYGQPTARISENSREQPIEEGCSKFDGERERKGLKGEARL